MAAFLRACFDGEGYAGKLGVKLATYSENLSRTLQLLLLNFGILSDRSAHNNGLWYLKITQASARAFAQKIGFDSPRKRQALQRYLQEQRWTADEWWDDQIVSIEAGRTADVFDVSVRDTHCYAAQGFINHNSYWHSTLMTRHFVEAKDVIDYADHHSGTVHMPPGNFNPYKIGIELFRDIEDRWNKGRFGKDYD